MHTIVINVKKKRILRRFGKALVRDQYGVDISLFSPKSMIISYFSEIIKETKHVPVPCEQPQRWVELTLMEKKSTARAA